MLPLQIGQALCHHGREGIVARRHPGELVDLVWSDGLADLGLPEAFVRGAYEVIAGSVATAEDVAAALAFAAETAQAPAPTPDRRPETPNAERRTAKKKKKAKLASLMNRPPPGGWTEADKVPDHLRRVPNPQPGRAVAAAPPQNLPRSNAALPSPLTSAIAKVPAATFAYLARQAGLLCVHGPTTASAFATWCEAERRPETDWRKAWDAFVLAERVKLAERAAEAPATATEPEPEPSPRSPLTTHHSPPTKPQAFDPEKFMQDTALADLRPWLNPSQHAVLRQLFRSEEGTWFTAKAVELAATILAMPVTYSQDGLGDQALVHLHYFTAGADWFLTEKDQGSPDDGPEDFQRQAFGLADLFQDGGELGYLSVPEILAAGAELDFHWTPKTIAEVRRQRARRGDAADAGRERGLSSPRGGLENPPTQPEPSPIATVSAEIADAFGMRGLPNVRVVDEDPSPSYAWRLAGEPTPLPAAWFSSRVTQYAEDVVPVFVATKDAANLLVGKFHTIEEARAFRRTLQIQEAGRGAAPLTAARATAEILPFPAPTPSSHLPTASAAPTPGLGWLRRTRPATA